MNRNDKTKKLGALGISVFAIIIVLLCQSCNNSSVEISLEDNDPIIEKLYKAPLGNKLDEDKGTVLYCDASAVLMDAKTNSSIYKAMRSQMNQYIETLVSINGCKFDTVECNKSEQKIHDALDDLMKKDGAANIQMAIENICSGNRQGMLITDFEFVKMDGKKITKCYDTDPYLTNAFIEWISKGYQIDFLVEPYNEGKDLKNRFYVFFTDPNSDAPISNTMLSQVKNFMVKSNPQPGECCLFTLNASDYGIRANGVNSCHEEIDMEEIDSKFANSKTYSISSSWKEIREYIMKLDEHEDTIEEETPIPLIDNLSIVQGNNYSITGVRVHATNISKSYLKAAGEEVNNPDEIWDISDAFDVKITKDNKIKVFLKKEIFKDKHLYSKDDGFSGNLIRIEFYVNDFVTNEYDSSVFEWTSCRPQTKGQTANCVSLSIDNALNDVKVVPKSDKHKILYTIFLQTESK